MGVGRHGWQAALGVSRYVVIRFGESVTFLNFKM